MPTAITGFPIWTLRATKGAKSYCGQFALPVKKPPPCNKAITGNSGEEEDGGLVPAGTDTLRVRHSVSLNWNFPWGRAC